MNLTMQETIAIVGVFTVFLTAIVAIIGLRWNKNASEAKDAQISSLKQQIESLKDRSPAELHKQMVSLKELMQSEVARLQENLDESNELL